MESSNVHTNCVKVQFGVTSKMPTDSEIFRFFQMRQWLAESLVAMFRAPREHCIYVKFKTEDLMTAALLGCPVTESFCYDSGETVQVSFSTGRGNFRYVRLFGLPVEVDNKHVVNVLGKYGKIHQTVLERYGADTGYPILNGVRGVHMELSQEIPCLLYIQHFQLRVFYEGITNKCYSCGSTEHIKINCPKRKSAIESSGTSPKTYAEAAKMVGEDQSPATNQDEQPIEVPEREKSSESVIKQASFDELPFSSSVEIPDAPVSKEYDDSVDLADQGRSISKKRLRSMHKNAKNLKEKESDSSPEKTKVPRTVRLTEEQAKLRRKK